MNEWCDRDLIIVYHPFSNNILLDSRTSLASQSQDELWRWDEVSGIEGRWGKRVGGNYSILQSKDQKISKGVLKIWILGRGKNLEKRENGKDVPKPAVDGLRVEGDIGHHQILVVEWSTIYILRTSIINNIIL